MSAQASDSSVEVQAREVDLEVKTPEYTQESDKDLQLDAITDLKPNEWNGNLAPAHGKDHIVTFEFIKDTSTPKPPFDVAPKGDKEEAPPDDKTRMEAERKAAEQQSAYDGRLRATTDRAREHDKKCVEMLSEWIMPSEELLNGVLLEGESILSSVPVVGFIGGLLDGKIGTGALMLTKLPDKEVPVPGDDSSKVMKVPQHRMHYMIQERSAEFAYNEQVKSESHSTTATSAVYGSVSTASSTATKKDIKHAYFSKQVNIGDYGVMKVDDEYLHAHAEWHDTAKISAYFSANSENKKTTATQGDGSCCEDFGTCLVACFSCKCFLECCPGLKCWLTCWVSCFQACCPCWKDCTACLKDCCFGTYKTVEVDETVESAEAAGRASTELNFERFIQQYEEASKVYKASTGLAMDSKDPEATLEGMMKTSTLSRKLHTMHMIYRSPDSVWSGSGDKLEAVIAVIAPTADVGDVNKFVSELERLFPALGGVNRDHLSTKDTDALKAALSGPFGSTSTSWHHHVSGAGAIAGFFNNESYVPSETDKFIKENPKTKVFAQVSTTGGAATAAGGALSLLTSDALSDLGEYGVVVSIIAVLSAVIGSVAMYCLTTGMAKRAFRLNCLGLVVTLVGITFYLIGSNDDCTGRRGRALEHFGPQTAQICNSLSTEFNFLQPPFNFSNAAMVRYVLYLRCTIEDIMPTVTSLTAPHCTSAAYLAFSSASVATFAAAVLPPRWLKCLHEAKNTAVKYQKEIKAVGAMVV